MTLQNPYLIVGRQSCEDAFQVRCPASNVQLRPCSFFLFFYRGKDAGGLQSCSSSLFLCRDTPARPSDSRPNFPSKPCIDHVRDLPYRWRLPEAGPDKPGYYKTSHVEITERMFARPVYRLGSRQSTGPALAPCGTCGLSEQARVQTEALVE